MRRGVRRGEARRPRRQDAGARQRPQAPAAVPAGRPAPCPGRSRPGAAADGARRAGAGGIAAAGAEAPAVRLAAAGLEEAAGEQHRAAPLKSPRWAEPGGPAALRERTPCQPPPGAVPPPHRGEQSEERERIAGHCGHPPSSTPRAAAVGKLRVNGTPAAPLGCQAAL